MERPEITVQIEGKTIKSVDYCWEDTTFVVVDKETEIEHRFGRAYLSSVETLIESDSVVTIPVNMSYE